MTSKETYQGLNVQFDDASGWCISTRGFAPFLLESEPQDLPILEHLLLKKANLQKHTHIQEDVK